MKHKKTFFSIMLVAMVATMCVGVTSCSKDNDKPEPDYGSTIIGRWSYLTHFSSTGFEIRSIIEFRNSGYSFDNLIFGSGAGDYTILENQKSKGVISYSANGFDYEVEYDGVLCKLLVSGSNDFDQMWVYSYQNDWGRKHIIVEFYAHNERLETRDFGTVGTINDPPSTIYFIPE